MLLSLLPFLKLASSLRLLSNCVHLLLLRRSTELARRLFNRCIPLREEESWVASSGATVAVVVSTSALTPLFASVFAGASPATAAVLFTWTRGADTCDDDDTGSGEVEEGFATGNTRPIDIVRPLCRNWLRVEARRSKCDTAADTALGRPLAGDEEEWAKSRWRLLPPLPLSSLSS